MIHTFSVVINTSGTNNIIINIVMTSQSCIDQVSVIDLKYCGSQPSTKMHAEI